MDKLNTVNKAALAGYLQKVINDSYKAEEKNNDGSAEAWLIGDKALLLILRCKYLRVTRRVYYRLAHNLYKNFGLSLVTMDRSVDPSHAGIDDITPEEIIRMAELLELGQDSVFEQVTIEGMYDTALGFIKIEHPEKRADFNVEAYKDQVKQILNQTDAETVRRSILGVDTLLTTKLL